MQQPRLLSNVTKSAIPIVSIENILTVIGDKQIVVSVVIIVSHAGPLPPARAKQLGVSSHIRKGSILVIVVEVTDGFLPLRKTFQRCSVDKKDIWVSIVVIVEESYTAACGFQYVLFVITTCNVTCSQACFGGYVFKLDLWQGYIDLYLGKGSSWALGNGHSLTQNFYYPV